MTIRGRRRHRGLLLPTRLFVAAVVVVLGVSCTPERRYRTLRFFFDGVPTPGEKRIEVKPTVSPQFIRDGYGEASVVDWPVHEPYRTRNCRACHAAENTPVITEKQVGRLCVQCHEPFFDAVESAPFQHGPVVAGHCTACHEPHESRLPHLLIREEPELCTFCHASEVLAPGPEHPDMEDRRCSACHDPHSGDTNNLLRPTPLEPTPLEAPPTREADESE